MTLKKSIVFIGSVLLLAACDRATAPTGPLSLHDGAAMARKDTARSTTTTRMSTASGGCQYAKLGNGDSTLVCSPEIE
jgi:hypothetical protein